MADNRRWTVVTGASSGIGRELAKQFASHGFDLLVTAEDEAIHAAAAELRIVDLNVRSTVRLAKHVVTAMVERGEGRVLFTSSIASASAPIISTPYWSRTPIFFSDRAQLSAVWPPSVARIASGRSFSMILVTNSGVIGST